MAEIGDLVRVIGNNEDFRITGYSRLRSQFQIRSVKGPIQIKSVDANCLEIVEKTPDNSSPGLAAIPEHWVTD
jgi:hypothetical protein